MANYECLLGTSVYHGLVYLQIPHATVREKHTFQQRNYLSVFHPLSETVSHVMF